MKRTLLALALALLIPTMLSNPSRASAHYIGCDSVDNGDIRWGSTTTYVSARDHAIAAWNAVGGINIAPDTIWTSEDVKFVDVNRSDVTWVGQYSCNAERIRFNRFRMDPLSDDSRKMVAVHELGHALRLGHSFPGQAMNASLSIPPVTLPQSHDIADYCGIWSCANGAGYAGGGGGGSGDRNRRVN
jgi:hypothetical protein